MRMITAKTLPTVAVAALLAACSSPAATSAGASTPAAAAASATTTGAPATSSPTAPASSAAAARTIDVTVAGTKITPAPETVKLKVGETLVLNVTSDHDDELHAHGFEVEKEMKAGVPVTMTLTTKTPGVYEVEMHHPALTLMKIQVQ